MRTVLEANAPRVTCRERPETIWFSEINEHVARVFSHHWPDVANLGDVTTIHWSCVPPVDILCGDFPWKTGIWLNTLANKED